jgi:DNA-binding response OmpR family regulator
LIVEDDPGIALGMKNDLTLEGHEVEVAKDGLAGLERARGGEFDLILLDIMLPKKDGYSVCREMRHAGLRTPILMLTARALEAEKVLGLELGVKAMLRRSAPEAPDIFRFGDVEVDFGRGEVRRGGQPVETTPLEFKLLTTFVRRPGRILTRSQLLDLVWRPDSCPTDRVIDNHIMNLRRKIERNPQEPRYLISVRGMGYRFDA